MSRRLVGVIWLLIGLGTLGIVRLMLPRNTVFTLGLLAGVAVGGIYTAQTRLSGATLSTAVVTLSTGVVVATATITIISAWWLPSILTATLGYAIGIVAAWLLVSGLSLDELGGFAAIGGLLLAVGGGAAGILFVDDLRLFIAVLFGGLAAGLVIPVSGLAFGLIRATRRGPRQSTEAGVEPATRFGIEAATIAGVAIGVPFGSRAAALFGSGGGAAFPFGVLCGVTLSVGIWAVGGGHSARLEGLRDRFVERVYRLFDRLEGWIERRRRTGAERSLDESTGGDGDGTDETAASNDAESLSTASQLLDGAASRLADHGLVIEAAEQLESIASANRGLRTRVDLLWSRFSGAVSQRTLTAGMALQLSAAEEAQSRGETEQAQSLTDAALELAAPTIGAVAAAVLRGRQNGMQNVLASLAPLFARIEQLLGEERLSSDLDDPAQFQLIQRLLERLIEDEPSEGFDTALARIRAAAADGWYSVQAGDQALMNDNYQRALVAYLGAIRAYRRAYELAEESTKTATTDRVRPDDDPAATQAGVTAAASTYAAEANRLSTAIEALCHDTAAVVIAATDELYGDEPPPTVDTEARRSIVRTLRALRQTRSRIDRSVPPVDLADDRYQRAEIARSIARLRRHLETADEAAASGNVEAAVEQYARTADRLDVLSNRAGTAGLSAVSRSLKMQAAAIGALAREPTPEAVSDRSTLSMPSTEDYRAPGVVPAGRRLRRTFCSPAFVELWAFVDEASDHPLLEIAGEPYPDLVGSVAVAIAGLDPLYTEPDVAALHEWVSEITLNALSAAVEQTAAIQTAIREADPAAPPTFREPPAVVRDGTAASVPTAEGVDGFAEAWLSRASALVDAKEILERRYAAVDGFAALEPNVRQTLQREGRIDASQVGTELLVVAAYNLTGVAYDADRTVLSKTGPIGRRSHDEPPGEPTAATGEPIDEGVDESTAKTDTDAEESA